MLKSVSPRFTLWHDASGALSRPARSGRACEPSAREKSSVRAAHPIVNILVESTEHLLTDVPWPRFGTTAPLYLSGVVNSRQNASLPPAGEFEGIITPIHYFGLRSFKVEHLFFFCADTDRRSD